MFYGSKVFMVLTNYLWQNILTFESKIIRPQFFHRLLILALSFEVTTMNSEYDVINFFFIKKNQKKIFSVLFFFHYFQEFILLLII